MGNTITYYQFSTNRLIHINSGNNDTIESLSDIQDKIGQSGNIPEKQEVGESRANQMYQIWGDNFVSDSLH